MARIEELAAKVDEARLVRKSARQLADALATATLARVFSDAAGQHGTVPLAKIATLERGRFLHRPRNEPRFFGGEHPWIQIGEIEAADKYIQHWEETLNETGLAISRKFSKGTLLVSIAATIGAAGILTFDCCLPDSVVGVIPKGEAYSSEYLYYFLTYARQDLERIAPQSAQKNINLQILSALPVPASPLARQNGIVHYLTTMDGQVRSLRHAQDAAGAGLNALLPSILNKAFKGEL